MFDSNLNAYSTDLFCFFCSVFIKQNFQFLLGKLFSALLRNLSLGSELISSALNRNCNMQMLFTLLEYYQQDNFCF